MIAAADPAVVAAVVAAEQAVVAATSHHQAQTMATASTSSGASCTTSSDGRLLSCPPPPNQYEQVRSELGSGRGWFRRPEWCVPAAGQCSRRQRAFSTGLNPRRTGRSSTGCILVRGELGGPGSRVWELGSRQGWFRRPEWCVLAAKRCPWWRRAFSAGVDPRRPAGSSTWCILVWGELDSPGGRVLAPEWCFYFCLAGS